jgi:hypothetical protein
MSVIFIISLLCTLVSLFDINNSGGLRQDEIDDQRAWPPKGISGCDLQVPKVVHHHERNRRQHPAGAIGSPESEKAAVLIALGS